MTDTGKLCVRDLMSTEMVTLLRNDRLSIAEDIMSLCRIRHLPVLGEDGEVVGVLSQRDLLYGALAAVLGYGSSGRRKLVSNVFVKEVMSPDPAVVAPDVPLAEAARIMSERKIGCLPVVEGQELVGILTEGDFVALYAAPTAASD
jgi:CBS domain-containing membrane protein